MKGGLLTIAGRAGEGFFGASTENVKNSIKKKQEEALHKRKLALEKIKQDYAQSNIRLGNVLTGFREEDAADRTEDAAIAKSERDKKAATAKAGSDEEAAVNKFNRDQTAKTDLEKKYKFATEVFGKEIANKLFEDIIRGKGDTTKEDRLKYDVITKANEMKESGASDAEINEVLAIIGEKWTRKGTGKFRTKGGVWGIGGTKEEITDFGPDQLLGGVPGIDGTRKGIAEGEHVEGKTKETLAATSFDEIMEKINPSEENKTPGSSPLSPDIKGEKLSKVLPSVEPPGQENESYMPKMTEAKEGIVDTEDMKKTAVQIYKTVKTTGDITGAIEKYFYDRNQDVGEAIKDSLAWILTTMVRSQKDARKETFE
jgi:hypothetical protein